MCGCGCGCGCVCVNVYACVIVAGKTEGKVCVNEGEDRREGFCKV